MKALCLSVAGLVAWAAGPYASAAGLQAKPSIKAPHTTVAAIYDWSGFYLGGNGGLGSSHECWNAATLGPVFIGDEGCHNAAGAVGGGQVGYWQRAARDLSRA